MYSRFSSYSQNKSVQVPRTYPEDIDCIIKSNEEVGSLYISNVEAAENIATLRRLKIGAVLTCAKGHQLSHPRSVVPYYKYVPAVDSESCDLSADFDKAVDFIVDTLKKTNVLVHCLAGVSRSVSMVIAYFIREHGMDYPTAYNTIRLRRKIINPNYGFIEQLKRYADKQRYAKTNMKYSTFSFRADQMINRSSSLHMTAKPAAALHSFQTTSPFKQDAPQIGYNTSSYFTPSKDYRGYEGKYKTKHEDLSYAKSMKIISPSYKNNEEDFLSTSLKTPQKSSAYANKYQQPENTSFEARNKELNDKLEYIHQKYENYRKKLFGNDHRYEEIVANRKKEVIDSPLKRTVTTRPRNDYARDYTPVRNTDRKSIDIRSDNKAAYQLSKYDSFDLTTALPSRNFLGTKYSFGQANYPMSSYTGTKPYQYLGVKNPQRYDLSRYR